MTHTRKASAAQARNNMTPVEAALWAEIKGLSTGTRWTRKKWRYGVLVDFYAEGLKLALFIADYGSTRFDVRKLERDAALLVNKGITVNSFGARPTLMEPSMTMAALTRHVYNALFGAARLEIEACEGVEAVTFEKGIEIHVKLNVPETQEIRSAIFKVARRYAPGALLHIDMMDAKDTSGTNPEVST